MKITVLQENLKHGLSTVSLAISSQSVLPVLSNVLITTENGRLRLSATDLEMSITCWIGAKIENEGETTIPARTFSDLVGTLPPDAISLDYDEAACSMRLQCGTTKTRMNCISAEEYPPIAGRRPTFGVRASGIPTFEGEGVQISVDVLLDMIRRATFSASSDMSRPVLGCILVEISEDTITFASADGFRLSECTAKLSSPVLEPISALIPAKALDNLMRILGSSESVTIMFDEGRVHFQAQDVEMATQLIEGNFPEYQQIIPDAYTTRTVVSTNALEKACRQAGIFARNDSFVAALNIAADTVEVFGQDEELGSNRTRVETTTEGPEIQIAFNTRFLQDALGVIRTPNVALEVSGPDKPGVIRPVGDDQFLHVIMPMNLNK